jgi:hypothetical protein
MRANFVGCQKGTAINRVNLYACNRFATGRIRRKKEPREAAPVRRWNEEPFRLPRRTEEVCGSFPSIENADANGARSREGEKVRRSAPQGDGGLQTLCLFHLPAAKTRGDKITLGLKNRQLTEWSEMRIMNPRRIELEIMDADGIRL